MLDLLVYLLDAAKTDFSNSNAIFSDCKPKLFNSISFFHKTSVMANSCITRLLDE